MKVLISSIGSRGDVQPIAALALELKALGHAPCLCVAPNFKEWVESFGLVHVPIGPDLKKLTGGTAPAKRAKPSKAQLHQLAVQMIRRAADPVIAPAPSRTFERQHHNLRVTRMPGTRDGTPRTRAGVPC
jgi:vancomycin aglycone glucosyltransferase